MALTVNQQPSSYTPVYNGIIFEATSSNYAQPNHRYTVKCTDIDSSDLRTYQIEARPNGEMVFDASIFAKNYVYSYVPNNSYGWKRCTDSFKKIRVNVGETYGSTPSYASGSNIDFYVWNAAVNWLDFSSYNLNTFVYNAGTSNYKYLNQLTSETTYYDKSSFLYILQSSVSDVSGIVVNTYSASGSLLGSSTISNPLTASADYRDRYVCIDVGYKGLANIASGLVTGTYPIITNSVASYDIYDPVADATIKSFTIGCEPRYTIYTLHYLNKNGNFETLHCSKLSETTVTGEKTLYGQIPHTLASNTWSYSNFTPLQKVSNSVSTTKIKVNTDWLSETELDYHRTIITSPLVYIDYGSSIGLIPVKVNTNQWLVNKKFNNKLYNVSLDLEFTFKDTFQNG